jgi:uncharacterized protein (DUF1778 family)
VSKYVILDGNDSDKVVHATDDPAEHRAELLRLVNKPTTETVTTPPPDDPAE